MRQHAFALACMPVLLLMVTVHVWGYETPPDLAEALLTADPGDILRLGFFSLPVDTVLNDAADQIPPAGGWLMHSRDPESVTGQGILYQETFPPGFHRLYFCHINETAQEMKMTAVFENLGDEEALVVIGSQACPNPTDDQFALGLQAVRWYHENYVLTVLVDIPPGGAATLWDFYSEATSSPGEMTNCIQDFGTEQPLRVTTVAVPATADAIAALPVLPVRANDGSGRQGTFERFSFENSVPLTYDTADGIMRISIADPSIPEGNAEIVGIDREASAEVTLEGNRGVTYRIRVDVSSSDGRSIALLMKPSGPFSGTYGSYFATFFPYSPLRPIYEGITVPTDTSADFDIRYGALIRVVEPPSFPQPLLIETMPPAVGAMPFDLLLVPFTPPPRPLGVMMTGGV